MLINKIIKSIVKHFPLAYYIGEGYGGRVVCVGASDRPPGSSRHEVGSEVRLVRLAPAPTIPALCRRLVRSMMTGCGRQYGRAVQLDSPLRSASWEPARIFIVHKLSLSEQQHWL